MDNCKFCPRCQEWLLLAQFGASKNYCKPCRRQYQQEWAQRNPGKMKKARHEYEERNKSSRFIAIAKWRQTEKGKLANRRGTQTYNERSAKAPGFHTEEQWQILLTVHKNRCVHCGTTERIGKDHIIPLSKGGSHYIENIQPMCHSCNSKKGASLANC